MTEPGAIGPGTWYLVPTAFGADGALDLASQRTLIEAAIGWGVDGLTVMGVMSEPGALTDFERRQTLTTIFEVARGRVPIVVGCSGPVSSVVSTRVEEAKDLGAAGVMVSAPTLLRNIDLLPGFFASVAAAGLPLIIQDEPAATGVTMPVSVLLRSVAESGAVSIKVEDPPTPLKISKLAGARPDLQLFGGLGGIAALHELLRGAAGTMTGFAYPEVMRTVRLCVERGEVEQAARIFNRFLPLIVFEAQAGVGLLVRKEVLRRRGAIASAMTRGAAGQIDPRTADELSDVLAAVGLTPGPGRLDIPVVHPAG